MNINNLMNSKENIRLIDSEIKGADSAYYSLKIGLMAYFSTYKAMKTTLKDFSLLGEKSVTEYLTKHIIENEDYVEQYIDLSIHIQHFFELTIKKTLEKRNKLLSLDVNKKYVLFDKLLNGDTLDENEYSTCKSVEFSEALERLCTLNKEGVLIDDISDIIANAKKELSLLNEMRNRILHRGNRIIKYYILDQLMTQNILPIIKKLLSLPQFESYNSLKLIPAISDSNIIDLLVSAGTESPLNYSKIAFYKEMGRALLAPLSFEGNEAAQRNYKKHLVINDQYFSIVDVGICPVCYKESLLRYYDVEIDIEELGDEMSSTGGFQILQIPTSVPVSIKCFMCGFEAREFIRSPYIYGFTDYDVKFWPYEKN